LIKIKYLPVSQKAKHIGKVITRGIIPPFTNKPHQTPEKGAYTSSKSSLWTKFFDNIGKREDKNDTDKIDEGERKTWKFCKNRIIDIIDRKK
jgi:hypothetical protein